MRIVSRYIRRMPANTTSEQFLTGVTATVRRHYRRSMLPRLQEHPEDRLTCSVVVFSRLCREVWLVGDCQCLIVNPRQGAASSQYYDNPKPYEAELAAMRADEVQRQMAEGKTVDQLLRNDTARPVIIPRMLETMRQQNVTYAVVDGFHIPRQHVRILTLDFQPWEVVLASDGYPFLHPTLAESEEALEHQRLNDPLNVGNFQATKAFHPDNNFYYMPCTQFSPNFSLHDEEMGDYVEMPAKVTGNDCFTPWVSQNDWYETVKLNYGVDYQGTRQLIFCPSTPNTWLKMRDILLFWASKGIDGFRCDMAEMVPCDFWGWVIPQVKAKYPDIIFIAEVYNPHEYRNYIERGHFDYLYDKVGLYDTIRSVMGGNSAACITGAWQSVDDIQSHMLNFLENHDEQRIASKFFAGNAEKGKPALLVSALMNTNPMMIYFGQELGEQGMYSEGFSGQDGKTTIFDYWTIDLIRRWRNNNKFDGTLLSKEEKDLQKYYTKVLNICNTEKAIREGLFFDVMYVNYNQGMNEHRQYAFLRKAGKELLVVIANFDDQPARSWVKIPAHAFECMNIPVSDKERECKDLLTGKKEKKALIPDGTLYVELPANGGKVLKFKL
jgi:hypothetical protein